AEALRIVTVLAHPVIPEATSKIWRQLGLGEIDKFGLRSLAWGQLEISTKLGKVEPVFPRADKSMIERMQQMEQQRSEPTLSPKEGEKDRTPGESRGTETKVEQVTSTVSASKSSPDQKAEGGAALPGSPAGAPASPSAPSSSAVGEGVG